MRELLLIRIESRRYGIGKEEIQAVREVKTVHRLPLSPACIAGVSLIDDRTVTLFDLAACLGHQHSESGKRRVLLLSGQDKPIGIMISGEIDSLSLPEDSILPVPEYLATDIITSCVVLDGLPFPLIDLSRLYRQLLRSEDKEAAPAPAMTDAAEREVSKFSSIRLLSVIDQVFGVSAADIETEPVSVGPITELPSVPHFVRGVVLDGNRLVPIIDLSQRIMHRWGTNDGRIMFVTIRGKTFGLLADYDRGTRSEGGVMLSDLPLMAKTAWFSQAVLDSGGIIPLIDLPELLSQDRDERLRTPLDQQYCPGSDFSALFKKQDVDLLEFSLLGSLHALPKNEIEDVIAFKLYRAIPDTREIVIGVAEYNGVLLPVLDLAMVFGRRSLVTPEWPMIVVKNGDFRALVITEAVFGERRLPRDVQRTVPIHLPHEVVYGCYPDGNAVRLILNVHALAVHFKKSLVQELLPAMTVEMKEAAAEIVPSLFDGGEAGMVPSFAQKTPAPGIVTAPTTPAASASLPVESVPAPGTSGTTIVSAESFRLQGEEEKPDLHAAPEGAGEQQAAGREGEGNQEILPLQDAGADAFSPVTGAVTEAEQQEIPEPQPPLEAPAVLAEATRDEPGKTEDALPEQAAYPPVIAETPSAPEPVLTEELQETSSSFSEKSQPLQEEQSHQEPLPRPHPVPEAGPEYASTFSRQEIPIEPVQASQRFPSRRLLYGVVAALLAIIIYFIGAVKRADLDKPDSGVPPLPQKPVSAETKPVHREDKPVVPLVLEIPAHRPIEIDVYVVVKGDTLWSISERFTGNPFNYPRVAGENRIANPDLIFPGQKIRLARKQR
jgi:chemotaxis signal transduction protein/nucleoid-associated protein YgaU